MIFLCFGDSLTSGFPGYDPQFTGSYPNVKSQYLYWLNELCQEYVQEQAQNKRREINLDLQFINKGIAGELTGDLLRRVKRDVLKYKPKPDYCIIEIGTNDLGWGLRVEEILKNIKILHKMTKDIGIINIGTTIPPIVMENLDEIYMNKKYNLNTELCQYFQENNILYADLFNGMLSNKGLDKKYDVGDGLHFSVEGYKRMGTIIFNDCVQRILKNILI